MKFRNLATTKRGRWAIRYGVAAAAMLGAVGLTLLPYIGPELGPLIFLAMFFGAWYGGIGPGLLATLLFEAILVGLRLHAGELVDAKFLRDLLLIFFLGASFTLLMESLHAARRRAEASRQWLSAVLTSIGDAVIATDDGGRVLFVNPVAELLCGWPAAEAVSRPLGDVLRIVDERTRGAVESPAVRVLAEGAIVGLANRSVLISRDGTERPIDDSGAPIRSPDGQVDGVVLVFRDVTERRRIETRISEEARRKDEFLAMLAHELRNPLAAISNATQLLVRPEAHDVHGWSREVIERQVRQLTRLVDDLLDISRISRGKIRLNLQSVDLAAVIRAAVQVIRPMVDDRGHDLRLSVADEPFEVEADPMRLEQVIVNLLNNAAKYTQPGGRIELELGREQGQAVIRVSDTGIGIGPELLPHVFDMFTQGDRALTRAEGGLGIGLTMVQKLVGMHGGRVDVKSGGHGLGSEFTVHLPARTGPAITLSALVSPEPARLVSPGEAT